MVEGLLIASQFPPAKGGIQEYLYNLYAHLPEGMFKILARAQPGGIEFDRSSKVDVTRVRCPGGVGYLKHIPFLASAMRNIGRGKVRQVHCGIALPDGMVGYALKRLTGRPYLVFAYGSELYDAPGRASVARRVLRDADLVVPISRFTRSRLLELGVDESRIEILHPAVDTDFFSPGERDDVLASALGLAGRKVILSIGRLVERKGFDTVIRALPQVLKTVPNACYVMAGGGEYSSELKKLRDQLGLQDHVVFAGSPDREAIPAYYRLCDVFVMPSRTLSGSQCEGFGIVFLEAAASGRPAIGGLSGGIPDAIVDGVTGHLVDPTDVGALAERIISLLTDPELAKSMGQAARQRAVEEFQVGTQARRLCDLMDRIPER